MDKKIILLIFVIAFLAIFLPRALTGTGGSSDASLVTLESVYDFGEISMSDGIVETRYTLANTGDRPITIQDVYTSCMCTRAEIIESGVSRGIFGMPGHSQGPKPRVEILPGQLVVIKAIFDPAAHGLSGVGKASRSIYVKTNSRQTPEIELHFEALVKN